jgi:hypothetical protein
MNGLRLPTVFPLLSSTHSLTTTTTAAAGELEHNSSNLGSSSGGDGLGSSSSAAFSGGKAQFQYNDNSSSSGSPFSSGKILVTQGWTEPTKGTLTPPKSHTLFFFIFIFCFTPSSCPFSPCTFTPLNTKKTQHKKNQTKKNTPRLWYRGSMQAHPLTSLLLAFSSPFLLSPSTFVLSFPRPGAPPRDSPPHHARNRNSHHGGQSHQQQGRNNSMGDCHSTFQRSRQQQQNSQSVPSASSFAHPRPESSSAGVATAWVLPPIPTFEELGLRFDRSRTSSMNAITEGERLRAESQQQIQMQDIHRDVTHALLQDESSSNGNGVFESTSACPWSSDEHAAVSGGDNVVVMPDMIPDNQHPSIFDDILSDDNEAYIIWSIPSTKTNPFLSSSAAGPSSSGGVVPASVAALSESVKQHPAGSDAHSASAAATTTQHQQHHQSSSLEKGATSAGQDHSLIKRWSTIEPLNARITETNRSTENLQLSLGQPKPVKQEYGSSTPTTTAAIGSNLRLPKTTTTATAPNITTATELQQKNRVIMAATVEKLVEKLTSEIGKSGISEA